MEILTVLRYPSEKDWTLSEFYIMGQIFGYGIEDEHRDVKVHGETRIANGTYELCLTHSPKFSDGYYVSSKTGAISKVQTAEYSEKHKLITLKSVPNFSRVLWHWGNTDDDTDACYITGESIGILKGQKAVLGSRKKYEQVYPMIASLIRSNESKGIKSYVTYKDKYSNNLAV